MEIPNERRQGNGNFLKLFGENPLGVGVGAIQNPHDLLIHLGSGLLRAVHIRLPVQILILHGSRGHEAEFLAHAVLGDHVPGQRTMNGIRIPPS